MHHNIIPSYNQQDPTFLDLCISKDVLHVSGSSSAHHQEYTTVQTVVRYCQPILLLAVTVNELERQQLAAVLIDNT
jgi:hypothetical protein